MQNIPSNTFREVLCEMMAQHLSLEYSKTVGKLGPLDFTSRLMQGYLPSLPPMGREAAPGLAKYCIVTSFLFRAWAKEREMYPGLLGIVNDAIRKREERVETLKGPSRAEVEG